MLPSDLINSISDMKEEDMISIKGKLSKYNDKNNNLKTIITCSKIEILENIKDKNNNVEMERQRLLIFLKKTLAKIEFQSDKLISKKINLNIPYLNNFK